MVRRVMKVGRTSILVVTLLLSTMSGAVVTGSTDSTGVSSLNNPNTGNPNTGNPNDPNTGNPNTGNPNPSPSPSPNKPNDSTITGVNPKAVFLANGKPVDLGTVTDSIVNGQTVTTISLDQQMVDSVLAAGVSNEVITIPVNTDSEVVVTELNGAAAANLGGQQVTLNIIARFASYNLPMDQVNIDEVIGQLGPGVEPEDVTVGIKMAQSTDETVEGITNVVEGMGGVLLGNPVSFDVMLIVDGYVQGFYNQVTQGSLGFNQGSDQGSHQVVTIINFDEFVGRTIAIQTPPTSGNGIVVGGVIEPDGTFRPTPTSYSSGDHLLDGGTVRPDGSIIFPPLNDRPDKTGKSNSTYVVFYNSVAFDDAKDHWAKDTINEMGSRMIVSGTDDGKFNPETQVTRAEFAAMMVRGLGLKLEKGNTKFSDIKATAWYNDRIKTANAHGLINGFEDGTFRPNEKITREQAMVIMSVAMSLLV